MSTLAKYSFLVECLGLCSLEKKSMTKLVESENGQKDKVAYVFFASRLAPLGGQGETLLALKQAN